MARIQSLEQWMVFRLQKHRLLMQLHEHQLLVLELRHQFLLVKLEQPTYESATVTAAHGADGAPTSTEGTLARAGSWPNAWRLSFMTTDLGSDCATKCSSDLHH
ncbi:hypothetical protein MRX96_052080 [Rhipicephalus microplus]